MNKLNVNYESLRIEYANGYYLDYLEDFPINYNKLKKIEIYNNSVGDAFLELNKGNDDQKYEESRTNSIVFPLILKATNLIHLSITYYAGFSNKISPKTFEFINKLKNLEYLKLDSLDFESKLILNLCNLRNLELKHCSNIDATNETYLKLKIFKIFKINTWEENEGKRLNKNILNYCPDLEEIKFCVPEFDIDNNINLKKLKKYKGNLNMFCLLESPLLEEANLKEEIESVQQFKKIIDKISSLKYLKILHLNLKIKFIKHEEISKIKFNNNLITEMYLNFSNDKYENSCLLFSSFQNNFRKLSNLYIKNKEEFYKIKGKYSKYPLFKIIENKNSNLKNINIKLKNNLGIKIYCQPFENIESVKISFLEFSCDSLNMEFPIFTNKCYKEFKSLKSFKLKFECSFNFDIFYNLNNNLYHMPNLIKFSLKIHPKKDELYNYKKIYKIFLNNILSMKNIKRININIFGEENYSKDELEQIFPDCNINKLSIVNISKIPGDEVLFDNKNKPFKDYLYLKYIKY